MKCRCCKHFWKKQKMYPKRERYWAFCVKCGSKKEVDDRDRQKKENGVGAVRPSFTELKKSSKTSQCITYSF